jgi:hypothetical protein
MPGSLERRLLKQQLCWRQRSLIVARNGGPSLDLSAAIVPISSDAIRPSKSASSASEHRSCFIFSVITILLLDPEMPLLGEPAA